VIVKVKVIVNLIQSGTALKPGQVIGSKFVLQIQIINQVAMSLASRPVPLTWFQPLSDVVML